MATVNGLDPEGILWIRNLMHSLANQGRTGLVSSHLMNEMAVTADHLIVIGRGRTFVELKKTTVGARTKIPHLSYIGDADIGAGANIGAGTITCNYDGYFKHKTVIDPTLATFAFLKQKDGDINTPFAPIADNMPPDVKRGFAVGTMKIPDEATLKRYEKSYAKMVEFVGRAYRAKPAKATDGGRDFAPQDLSALSWRGVGPARRARGRQP